MQPAAHYACPHCGTPVALEGTFCCHGCEAAAALVRSAGLEAYLETREAPAPRSRTAHDVNWDRLPVTTNPDGTCSVTLDVHGFRCASCVWVTEGVLTRTEGVRHAQVSYGSGRTRLSWDPELVGLQKLADTIALLGYRPRPSGTSSEDDRDLLVRLGVASFSAMNVMGLSAAIYAGWLDGMAPRHLALFRWLSLLVATPSVTWAAAPFFSGAWQSLRHRLLHVDLPVAMAIGLLYGHGVWATLAGQDGYLDSVTMLVALLLGGRVLEARGRKHTADAAASLSAAVPRSARRVTATGVEQVDTSDLRIGDHVVVGDGGEIPADGIVVEGTGEVQLAVVTGEAEPVTVGIGAPVVGGAVVQSGLITLGVTRTGDDTLVARMARSLGEAADRPRQPSLADRMAPAFTAGTLGVALTTGLLFWASGDTATAISRTAAVLVVACPCALALARPLVGSAALGAVARRGLLLRGLDALDRLATVDVALLDKTGTLTTGRPSVTSGSDHAVSVAASLERGSRHPVANALLDEAVRRGLPLPPCSHVHEEVGVGVTGRVDGVPVSVRGAGPGVVAVASEGLVELIHLADRPRPAAAEDVADLGRALDQITLLTGDHEEEAARIALSVGLDDVRAGVQPEGKREVVEQARSRGHSVLFVGDGLNDGPALAAADVGISMATGAASSVLVADGVLVADRLAPLALGTRIARIAERRTRHALMRSVAYNVIAVCGAVLGFVNPLVAAILMPLSSAWVLADALSIERTTKRLERS